MNYGRILSESFQTFWKHKSIWVFGIVAALVGRGDYSVGVRYRESVSSGDLTALPEPWRSLFVQFLNNPLPNILLLVAVGIVVGLILGLVGWFARGAIIGMVDEADRSGETSLGSGWQIGKRRFLSLFVISLILSLPQLALFAAALALTLPLWLPILPRIADMLSGRALEPGQMQRLFGEIMPNLFGIFSLLCGLICLGVLISLFMYLWRSMAARSCVIENLGIIDSLRRGWHVTTRNLGHILLCAIFLAVLGAVYGFIVALPALLLWAPAAQALPRNNWSPAVVLSAFLAMGYLLIMSVILGGILTSFNDTLWTKLYKALVSRSESAPEPAT